MIAGGITTPKGFRAAGISAGIKAREGALDLALLVSDRPATAAAVFTINRAQAAPVVVSRDNLRRSGGIARAIVVNSGCANACTGDAGFEVAHAMAAETGAAGRLHRRPGPGRLDRRHRRRARFREDPARAAEGDRRPRRRPGRARRSGDHDDRSVPQGSGGAHRRRRSGDRDRRHGQRLRDDRADDGDHARLHHDRRGGAWTAARSGAARGGRRHLQCHHRRRRMLDQRLRDGARQRRQRRDDRRG